MLGPQRSSHRPNERERGKEGMGSGRAGDQPPSVIFFLRFVFVIKNILGKNSKELHMEKSYLS